MSRYTTRATITKELAHLNIKHIPKGQKIELRIVDVFHMKNGKIVSARESYGPCDLYAPAWGRNGSGDARSLRAPCKCVRAVKVHLHLSQDFLLTYNPYPIYDNHWRIAWRVSLSMKNVLLQVGSENTFNKAERRLRIPSIRNSSKNSFT